MLNFLKLSLVNHYKILSERKGHKIYRIGNNFNLVVEDVGGVLRCRAYQVRRFARCGIMQAENVKDLVGENPIVPTEICKIKKQNIKWYMYRKDDLDYFWECVNDVTKWYEKKDNKITYGGGLTANKKYL